MNIILKLLLFAAFCHFLLQSHLGAELPQNFRRQNLVAWCIVPFDAAKRTPQERAEMLVELGLRRCAYDWREENVPQFEEEIRQYQSHGIEFFAFWDTHERAIELFEEYEMAPQFWRMVRGKTDESPAYEEKVEQAAMQLLPLAKDALKLGSSFGIYNHGGWAGEPENMVAVTQALRERLNSDKIGIVYNFHHAHDQIDHFPEALELMMPYLLCINLNGMSERGETEKILPIGSGEYERQMIRAVITSGYAGPIGILDHINEQDAKVSLQRNLEGLERVLDEVSR